MKSDIIHLLAIRIRAKEIARRARTYFDDVIEDCAGVSEANKSISFVVKRVGIFGGPKVIIIERPEIVTLNEKSNCVVIKDGYIYNLVKS